MNGLGFYIWQLKNMPEPYSLAKFLKAGGVKWVTIKVLDGVDLYNASGNNQKLLKEYYQALKEAGISAGGWQYCYGYQPGLEGDMALAFWEEFRVPHFFIDAEAEYKGYGMAKKAKAYCDKLHNGAVDVYLSTYRFPSYHGSFPFSAFLNHDKVDGVAPQLYWVGSHNPAEQLERSFQEYSKFTDKPFVPIGSAYGSSSWMPTVDDFKKFTEASKKYGAWGYWSLDWILTHKKMDWWEAITGVSQEPEPEPEPDFPSKVFITADKLNIRNSTVVSDSTFIGHAYKNTVWYPDGVELDTNNRKWYYFGEAKKIYLASWWTKEVT